MARMGQAAILLCLLLYSMHLHKQSRKTLDEPIAVGFITHAQGIDSMGAKAWGFDFLELERLLESVPSAAGELLLNSDTLNKLDLAYRQVERQKNTFSWSRLQLLVEKSFSNHISKELYLILHNFHQYQSNIELQNSDMPRPEKLAQQIDWQIQIFGQQAAGALFAKRNLQARYMLDRLTLQSDSNLDLEVKQQRLKTLQAEYKRRLSLLD